MINNLSPHADIVASAFRAEQSNAAILFHTFLVGKSDTSPFGNNPKAIGNHVHRHSRSHRQCVPHPFPPLSHLVPAKSL